MLAFMEFLSKKKNKNKKYLFLHFWQSHKNAPQGHLSYISKTLLFCFLIDCYFKGGSS